MSMVTISDHNTIDGAIEIAHLPDTFISEEITTYFPEDGCKAHVLALKINEAHHREIQKIRQNIFDLVAYLNRENIVHILAHPLYGVNDRLTLGHFEQMLLLFKNFELNGARNDSQNKILSQVLSGLTKADIDRKESTRFAASRLNGSTKHREDIWFDFVNRLSSKVLSHTGDLLLGQVSGAVQA